ncbi:MAG: zinc ribbon domain-containing protein [Candidatus Marinimicrobia bacterium]|nr:zinc ribbon domain-containing protein [Candidatus Neomarinimicrobiota bacterium]
MPIYEYKCNSCGKVFNTLVLSSSVPDSDVNCNYCNKKEVKRLLTTKISFGNTTTTSKPAGCRAPAGSSFG